MEDHVNTKESIIRLTRMVSSLHKQRETIQLLQQAKFFLLLLLLLSKYHYCGALRHLECRYFHRWKTEVVVEASLESGEGEDDAFEEEKKVRHHVCFFGY